MNTYWKRRFTSDWDACIRLGGLRQNINVSDNIGVLEVTAFAKKDLEL